jgi:undecaprenyl-diphosphatase
VRKLLLLSALFLVPFAFAQPVAAPADPAAPPPAAELSIVDAIILGTVEGITEYLPISSTGHLIIATRALHLDQTATLHGRDGEPLWFKKPSAKHPAGEPLTLKLAADTYTVVIQFGAIAAVALLYWRQIRSMILGLLGRDIDGFHLLRNVLIAFFPAAVIGLAAHGWIDAHFSVPVVIAAQVVGALVILWAESYRKRRTAPASVELSARQSLNIGLFQCLALWPGISRSMTTIVGGYLAGLDPRRAAEFSFLLGFVTLTAATLYKSYQSGGAMIAVFGWPHVLLGCVVATVTAAGAVKFLVGWLSRHGMALFAYYRLGVAALLAGLLGLGWL